MEDRSDGASEAVEVDVVSSAFSGCTSGSGCAGDGGRSGLVGGGGSALVLLDAKRVRGGLFFWGEVVVGELLAVEVKADAVVLGAVLTVEVMAGAVVLGAGTETVKSVGDGISITMGNGCVIGG